MSDKKEEEECICQKTAKEIISICQGLQEWALDLLANYPCLDGEILDSLNRRMDDEVTRVVDVYTYSLEGKDPEEIDEELWNLGVDSRCCEAKKHDLGPYSPDI